MIINNATVATATTPNLWEDVLRSWGAPQVICALKGRCPTCGRDIDLSVPATERKIHLCPKLPTKGRRIVSVITETGKMVMIGPREDVLRLVTDLRNLYGIVDVIAIAGGG